MRSRVAWTGIFCGGMALLGAACSSPRQTPAMIVPTPIFAEPVIFPTPLPSPAVLLPTVRASCANAARFVEDLTIPDGTHVALAATLDKRWSVQNSGTCDWGPEYRLVHQGGSGIEGPSEVALYPARAGAQAVWQVSLQAPGQPGEYQSRWQAQAPDGSLFGDEVFIIIVVDKPAGTSTPVTARTP